MRKAIKQTAELESLSGPEELDQIEQGLLDHAQEATGTSYAPYSGFRVGAAVLLEDGTMVLGSNQENGSYPEGQCAERVALFATGSQHPNKRIMAIAIAARRSKTDQFYPVSPCGGCRQVMLEYEQKQHQPIKVLFRGQNQEVLVADTTTVLLPFAFDGSALL